MARSPSRSKSKSRSRSGSVKKRSLSKSPSRSRGRSRSRSRSPVHKGRSPRPRSRSRSLSRSRSRSRSHSGTRRNRSRSRSPRRRRVGSGSGPLPNKCLGVFGLNFDTTERTVEELFETYGKVESCKLIYDRGTGRSKGFCFINMKTLREAEEAKESLNEYNLDGARIRVDFSTTSRPHSPTPGRYMGRPDQMSRRPGYRAGGGYHGSAGYRAGGGYSARGNGYRRSRSRSRSPYYRDRY